MPTLFEIKEQSITDAPLLMFDCELANARVERWCTHAVTVNGNAYNARVLQHNLFSIQTASDQGLDAIPKISITLANADSYFSQIEREVGFKGAKITVYFAFCDLRSGTAVSENTVLFRGVANPPEEIREATFRLSAINRMSLQRVLLPQLRIQRRCAWDFPATAEQRVEACNGGEKGRYSRFFRCGYSADVEGGCGNTNTEGPFTSCGFTRSDCDARGMFRQDSAGRPTRRFGGVEFVPSQIQVRTSGDKDWQVSAMTENEARYNDFVPVVYGTAWYKPPIVFARNDGNLTHMEVLLGIGEIESVIKVLVNEIEIPLGQTGKNMTGTGWFNVISLGNRTGTFNEDFRDSGGVPAGDPYGSMAYMSLVVPNRINDGQQLPRIQVLLEGLKLPRYSADGEFLGDEFTNNPAWVLLDMLQRSGWRMDEIDIPSFAAAAEYCAEQIPAKDLNGNDIVIPRFACNLVLQKRRSAADTIRGIRNAARLCLTYGAGALLQLRVENTLALQQPARLGWSNSRDALYGGWPSYEFGDGSNGFSGVLRRESGEPNIRVWSRSTIETPNRFSIEFQDELNGYQQDSFELVDTDDAARAGQEIAATLNALGIPNFDQAGRIAKFNLDRSIGGNCYIEFETSVRGLGLRPGDLITLTYLKEGFARQAFRVLKVAPALNYRTVTITAQIHNDAWYADTNGRVPGEAGGRELGGRIGLPRPLIGDRVDGDEEVQFTVVESAHEGSDGGVVSEISVGFMPPQIVQTGAPVVPVVSLAATVGPGGTLAGGQTLYYGVSAVDDTNHESRLSFIVRASIAGDQPNNAVTLHGLSFGSGTVGFHVYRGPNPMQLFRIASNQPPSSTFCDTGLAKQLVGPPDPNFDHANFYWRLEVQPECAATLHDVDSIGNDTLEMPVNAYRGMIARITRGLGAGQDRAAVANTATVLNVSPKWDIPPDANSYFVISEAGWHFAATARTSPVQFEIPNRAGAIVEILGRAANASNQETPYELSTMTRWVIGGSGGIDPGVPPAPMFSVSLAPSRPGILELSGVAFTDLTNTRTATAGSLTLHYWSELGPLTPFHLAEPIGAGDTELQLDIPGNAQPGSLIQIESEVLRVEGVADEGRRYEITRGLHTTGAEAHGAATLVYHLESSVAIVPFARDFFGSPASGNWSYPIWLPNVRVASAELFMTNTVGPGPAGSVALTQTIDNGLRTLAGGQYSMQVDGFLAIQTAAVPELVVEAPHAVCDIFAVVKDPPLDGSVGIQVSYDGSAYCHLTIPSTDTISNVVSGFGLPYLSAGARIGMDIVSVGLTNPGSDLTVIIRL